MDATSPSQVVLDPRVQISNIIDETSNTHADLFLVLESFFQNFRSPLTAKEYRATAKEFFSFVSGDVKRPEDLRRHHIIFYRKSLEERGLSNKTILKKLSGVSSLCRYLAEEGLIDKDLTFGVSRPKTENKRETADFSDDEVRKIFESLDPKAYTYHSHRAILAVGFYTGLRSAEIRKLRFSDIGEVKGIRVLRLKIKGDKIHEIPLHPFVSIAVEEHRETLFKRGFNAEEKDHILFPSLKTGENKEMSSEALTYILNQAIDRAGIDRGSFRRYSPHSMRATFAGHLLNTVDSKLEDVQRALGHANPSTTQKYNKRSKGHEKSVIWKIEF